MCHPFDLRVPFTIPTDEAIFLWNKPSDAQFIGPRRIALARRHDLQHREWRVLVHDSEHRLNPYKSGVSCF